MRLCPPQSSMIKELADELANFDREQLSQTTIVLPTGRIGRYLLSLLVDSKKAICPPNIVTLDVFIDQPIPNG